MWLMGNTVSGGTSMAVLVGALACTGFAQTPVSPIPKPDADGWIKIYRGNNAADFSVFEGNGSPSQNPKTAFGGPFTAGNGDTIKTGGSPNAQLIFRQNFSHYRMQVQLHWPSNPGNTGIMTKIQWSDTGQGSALPRAVECQGDPGQGMGQIWALGNIGGQAGGTWITVKAKKIPHPMFGGQQAAQVDSMAPEMDWGGGGAPNFNLIVGYPGWGQPRPAAVNNKGWVTFEVESHGHDTTRHFLDGQKVMEYYNPRIAPRNNSNAIIKRLTSGMLSVQSEGSQVWYRNWRIKLLPGDPLYESLYGPTVTLAPRPAASRASGLQLGFHDGVLTVLSEGRPISTLTGRRAGNKPGPLLP